MESFLGFPQDANRAIARTSAKNLLCMQEVLANILSFDGFL
jgi:hypothetical protein